MDGYKKDMCEYLEEIIRHHPHYNLVNVTFHNDFMFVQLRFEDKIDIQIRYTII